MKETGHQTLSRRNFFKTAATVGAAAAVGGALSGCAPSAAPEKAGAASDAEKLSSTSPSSEYMNSELYKQKWTFEIPPDPIPESDIAETVEAEIVVVGSGTSGLVTANSALEEGAKVVVVSASEKPVSRGGSNHAVWCKKFDELGLEKTDPSIYEKEIYADTCKVDQKKWYKFIANSETAANWAIDIMEGAGYKVVVEGGTPGHEESLYYQATRSIGWGYGDGMEPEEGAAQVTAMMQPLFVNQLAKRFQDMGGDIYYKTIAKQLVRDDGGKGRVSAVVCLREDGTYAKYVGTKAIVLATGDFSADREMMTKYCPLRAHQISDEVYDGETDYDIGFQTGGLYKGDGHKMGLWVGAAWQRSYPNAPMGAIVRIPGPYVFFGNHPGLLVDRYGERFMNEDATRYLAAETCFLQSKGEVYAIWDINHARNFQVSQGWNNDTLNEDAEATIASWDELVEQGTYVRADTMEELLSAIGLPPETAQTVDRYNELVRGGKDTDFFKDPSMLFEIKTPPFYADKSALESPFLTVMGGLRTDSWMRVCDENDDPIPGLYNVGVMVGDMWGGVYSFQIEGGNYGATCITFGYLTGKHIVENE